MEGPRVHPPPRLACRTELDSLVEGSSTVSWPAVCWKNTSCLYLGQMDVCGHHRSSYFTEDMVNMTMNDHDRDCLWIWLEWGWGWRWWRWCWQWWHQLWCCLLLLPMLCMLPCFRSPATKVQKNNPDSVAGSYLLKNFKHLKTHKTTATPKSNN